MATATQPTDGAARAYVSDSAGERGFHDGSSPNTPGRRALLTRIARFQRHEIEINAGISPAAVRRKLIEHLGLSKELQALQAQSLEYSRAARKAMLSYAAAQEPRANSILERSADLIARHVDYRGKGQPVARSGMMIHTWAPVPPQPPEPQSQWLPPDDFYRDCHITGEGVGSGIDWPWVSDNGTRGGGCNMEWLYTFLPSSTQIYSFSAPVIAAGPYSVYVDDGTWDSKEISVSVQASMQIVQALPSPIQVGTTTVSEVAASVWKDLFELDSQNLKDSGNCVAADKLEKSSLLFAGLPVNISVWIDAWAWARGEGSWVDVNFSRPDGVIAELGLTVDA